MNAAPSGRTHTCLASRSSRVQTQVRLRRERSGHAHAGGGGGRAAADRARAGRGAEEQTPRLLAALAHANIHLARTPDVPGAGEVADDVPRRQPRASAIVRTVMLYVSIRRRLTLFVGGRTSSRSSGRSTRARTLYLRSPWSLRPRPTRETSRSSLKLGRSETRSSHRCARHARNSCRTTHS